MVATIVIVSIIVLIILILIVRNIKIVPQAHAFVVERLGAYYATYFAQGLAQRAGRGFSAAAGHHAR